MARLLSAVVAVALALVLLTCSTAARSPRDPALRFATRAPDADPPRHSTGLSDAVQWDNYTLWVDGQRIFLQCAHLSPSPMN